MAKKNKSDQTDDYLKGIESGGLVRRVDPISRNDDVKPVELAPETPQVEGSELGEIFPEGRTNLFEPKIRAGAESELVHFTQVALPQEIAKSGTVYLRIISSPFERESLVRNGKPVELIGISYQDARLLTYTPTEKGRTYTCTPQTFINLANDNTDTN